MLGGNMFFFVAEKAAHALLITSALNGASLAADMAVREQ